MYVGPYGDVLFSLTDTQTDFYPVFFLIGFKHAKVKMGRRSVDLK